MYIWIQNSKIWLVNIKAVTKKMIRYPFHLLLFFYLLVYASWMEVSTRIHWAQNTFTLHVCGLLLVAKDVLKSVSQFHVNHICVVLYQGLLPPSFVAYNKHQQATLNGEDLHHYCHYGGFTRVLWDLLSQRTVYRSTFCSILHYICFQSVSFYSTVCAWRRGQIC